MVAEFLCCEGDERLVGRGFLVRQDAVTSGGQ